MVNGHNGRRVHWACNIGQNTWLLSVLYRGCCGSRYPVFQGLGSGADILLGFLSSREVLTDIPNEKDMRADPAADARTGYCRIEGRIVAAENNIPL